MEAGTVQISSWHSDTRDSELVGGGTAARMLNKRSRCIGYRAGEVGSGVDGWRGGVTMVLQVGWMRDGSHCWKGGASW